VYRNRSVPLNVKAEEKGKKKQKRNPLLFDEISGPYHLSVP
jgi:hypothetical protein